MTKKLRILLLDSSSTDAKSIEHYLHISNINYTLQRVVCKQPYLSALYEFSPDIILSEYKLADFNGMTALFIAREFRPCVPFIFVTSSVVDDLSIKSHYQQADAYVLKGALERLAPCIVDVLDKEKKQRLITQDKQQVELDGLRYKMAIDSLKCAFIVMDDKGQVVEWNKTAEKIFGYSKQEMLMTKLHERVLPEQARKCAIRSLKLFVRTGKSLAIEKVSELTVLHKNGYEFPLEISLSAIKLKESWQIIMVARDISIRKIKQQQVQRSEKKFRALFEQTDAFCMILDPDTDDDIPLIVDANEAACKAYGYNRKEIIGLAYTEIDFKQRKSLVQKITRRIIQGKPFYFERKFVQHGGRNITVAVNAVPINLDENTRLILTTEFDISERKEIEKALRESNARFKGIFNQAAVGMARVGLDGRWLEVNNKVCEIVGYRKKELLLKTFQDITHPDDLDEDLNYVKQLLNNEISSYSMEKRYFKKNGDMIWVYLTVSLVRDSDNKPDYFISIIEDITEKKQIVVQLSQHRNHLEAMVKTRTRELEIIQQQAEAANKAKSSFLSNMSHEIRTPMNAILGLAHLLRKKIQDPILREQLDKINVAGEHLLSVINDILDISKVEAGKLELKSSNFNLDVVFDNLRSLLNVQFRNNGLTFEILPFDFSPWLVGDSTRLRQALINYLSNAIKFTPSGKITLSVKKLKEQDGRILLRFEVQDTGIGIASDNLERLFHNFEQADKSSTRQFEGTGLGLAITKHLAHLMGGEVGVESKVEQGSQFWLTGWFGYGKEGIAISKPVSSRDLERTLRKQYAGASILLVEDNEINMEVAKDLLSDVGLHVDTAINGKEAVDKANSKSYDLILMDIQMPIMDGLRATREIRKVGVNRSLPILAMTAGVLESEKNDCRAAGLDDFVAKPIVLSNLYSSLIKWLPANIALDQDKQIPQKKMPSSSQQSNQQLIKQQLAEIKGLDSSIGLNNLRGDSKVYLRLLHLFDNSHARDVSSFKLFLKLNNIEKALKLAHTTKGSAGTLGLTELGETSRLLETRLREYKPDDSQGIMELLEALGEQFDNLHQALIKIDRKDLPDSISNASDDKKLSEVKDVLKQLEALLRINDSSLNNIYLDSEKLLLEVCGSKVEQLGHQIEMYNYPNALEITQTFLKSLE